MERLRYDDDTAFALADDASTLARIARTVPPERLRAERFGDWSALEVIGHVADMADVFAERVRRCVALERPRLPSVDQDAVAAERRNDAADPVRLAARVQDAHGLIVRLLGTPANRARVGVHGEWGEVDAAHLAAYQARHSHEHVGELAARFPPTR